MVVTPSGRVIFLPHHTKLAATVRENLTQSVRTSAKSLSWFLSLITAGAALDGATLGLVLYSLLFNVERSATEPIAALPEVAGTEVISSG